MAKNIPADIENSDKFTWKHVAIKGAADFTIPTVSLYPYHKNYDITPPLMTEILQASYQSPVGYSKTKKTIKLGMLVYLRRDIVEGNEKYYVQLEFRRL